jgi:hypothetical protein
MNIDPNADTQKLPEDLRADGLDEETLAAIDQAEDEIERGEVHDWKDVREQVRAMFLKTD